MEAMDIYDKDRQPVGLCTTGPKSLGPGQYRLVVHLCIFNSKAEMLIQRRRETCGRWPGRWDFSVRGCALAGETGRMAAMREAKEELNLDVDLDSLRPALTVSFAGGYDELFLLRQDLNPEELLLQAEEVAEVRWASKEELLKLRTDGCFTPVSPAYLQLLFDLMENGDVMAKE